MPNRTVYLRDCDVADWDRAKELLGSHTRSFSTALMDAVRRELAEKENAWADAIVNSIKQPTK